MDFLSQPVVYENFVQNKMKEIPYVQQVSHVYNDQEV